MNRAQSILKNTFGFDTFLPLQEKIIAHILNKRDALIVMPTGGGKSLCYQLPSIIFDGLTIVVTPLISLMKDQVDQLTELGVPSLFLNSSLDMISFRRNVEKLRSNSVKLLYLSPEALLSQRILALLADLTIDCIAIDEAHCISEWGHDFRPEYRQLAEVRTVFPSTSCVALTATATPRVREDICRSLNIDSQNEYVGSFDRPNLFLEVTPKIDAIEQVLTLIDQNPHESGIIYCATRRETDKIYTTLKQKGYSVLPYHAGLSEKERAKNQELFSRDDIRIIVATIAFGMGINKPNVRFVIHYNMPHSIDNYYQEIGRAGRDGLPAHCLLLFNYGDIHKVRFFIEQKSESEQKVANILLDHVTGFAETDLCRRIPLLNYFGDANTSNSCGMCDNCRMEDEKKVLDDLTIPAQMFLSCVKRTGEIFGAGHIINVLRGSKSQKIFKFEHEKLSTYGIGLAYSARQWRYITRQLIQKGLLQNDYDHGSLKLTPKAWKVLRGEEVFFGKAGEAGKEKATMQKAQQGEVDTYDTELFEMLRGKRKELADHANLPPYVIFHDRTLREMAFYYPQTQESFIKLYGIGRSKLEKYADAFLDIIRMYCQTHQLQEKQQSSVVNQSFTAPQSNNEKSHHKAIGKLFNQGHTIDQLASDFGVKRNTIIDHLYRYISQNGSLQKQYLIANSSLTKVQWQSALSSFSRLGTNLLRPIFDDLNETISYDELKIVRLYVLNQEQACTDNTKTFVVLAASRKYGGYCVAGKEWTDGKIGAWIRPVSQRTNGELVAENIRMNNNELPCLMDIVEVETQGPARHAYQKENFFAAGEKPWIWQLKLPDEALTKLLDFPESLWLNGFSSTNGLNDRVPEEIVVKSNVPSIYLIQPDDFSLLVTDDLYGRKKVYARLTYREMSYLLSVTDMGIEREYLMKPQDEYSIENKDIYLTISLGEPFNGFCYKLVAAVMMQNKDCQ